MLKVPAGWQKKKLGDICHIVRGASPRPKGDPLYFGGNIPWIKIADVTKDPGKYLYSTEEFLTEEGRIKSVYLDPGTLIITNSATIGIPKILRIAGCIHDGFLALLNLSREVERDYLYYFFLYIREHLTKIAPHGTQRNLNTRIARSIEVPLPPLATQKHIVDTLDKINDLSEKRDKADQLTNRLLQSIFLKMFGDPLSQPREFPISNIIDVVRLNPPKREIHNLHDELEITFLPMASVSNTGRILQRQTKKLHQVRKGYTYFKEDDVLFAKITPCMENGKGAIARGLKNGIGFGSTEFYVFRPNKSVTSEWLFFLLGFSSIREAARKSMRGTAGQKRVPKSFFNGLQVPVPPKALQERFVAVVRQLETLRKYQLQSKEKIDEMFSSLMQNAFRGRLSRRSLQDSNSLTLNDFLNEPSGRSDSRVVSD